jgi:Double zinc ribbon
MTYPRCRSDNAAQAKFCEQCGTRLAASCSSCGAQTLPDRQVLRRVRPSGVPGRGVAHYRKSPAVAEARGMRPLVANCHLGLGKLSRRTGQREQARHRLTTATTLYREVDMRFWLEKAKAELRG